MEINVKDYLNRYVPDDLPVGTLQLPDISLETEHIRVIMVNGVPPQNPADSFYSRAPQPDYLKTVIPLFQTAGVQVQSMNDILQKGIYITTAVKSPKSEYTVDTAVIKAHLPLLAAEIEMFPRLEVVMLMGDVAKKAFNLYSKQKIGKNTIPTGSTYKIRKDAFYYEEMRVFPSYIMTGGNILIEKSKCVMIAEDIQQMMQIL